MPQTPGGNRVAVDRHQFGLFQPLAQQGQDISGLHGGQVGQRDAQAANRCGQIRAHHPECLLHPWPRRPPRLPALGRVRGNIRQKQANRPLHRPLGYVDCQIEYPKPVRLQRQQE